MCKIKLFDKWVILQILKHNEKQKKKIIVGCKNFRLIKLLTGNYSYILIVFQQASGFNLTMTLVGNLSWGLT
jgi:hypothetical protein